MSNLKHSNCKRFFSFISLVIIALSLNAMAAQEEPSKKSKADQTPLANYKTPTPTVYSGGQPREEQLQAFAALGGKQVVNLRPESEQGWNESASVKALGMNYVSIPVEGAAGVTWENAAQLKSVLDNSKDTKVLLHCASGNRVGALMALNASRSGETLEDAIEYGKAWGMTGLESKVREVIQSGDE